MVQRHARAQPAIAIQLGLYVEKLMRKCSLRVIGFRIAYQDSLFFEAGTPKAIM
jgi:hypothetical protein